MEETVDLYVVLKNHEDQYSIWIADLPIPPGWEQQRGPGSKEECLEFVRLYWTDMRPASLRRAMES